MKFAPRFSKPCFFAILLGTLILGSCSAPPQGPNILFVLSDDQSWTHVSYTGEPGVETPNFDRIAQEGMFFPRAYVSAPSCTPSRSAILAGQHFWRLGAAGVLWGEFGNDTLSYQRILAAAGYHTGYTGKGWGPGLASGGDPVGQGYNSQTLTERPSIHISATDYAGNFAEFLDERPDDTPFSFWVSPFEPHRPYEGRAGSLAGIRLDTIRVPDFLPDTVAVRQDLANYYLEINWLDQVLGQVVAELEQRNLLENTIIVVTSDNGMPFPRAKADKYDNRARVA